VNAYAATAAHQTKLECLNQRRILDPAHANRRECLALHAEVQAKHESDHGKLLFFSSQAVQPLAFPSFV